MFKLIIKSMNFNLINVGGISFVSALELQKELGLTKAFSTWIKTQIERAFLEVDKDFIPSKEESTGGRQFTDYLLTVEAAKRIAIVSHTKESKKIIDYLLELDSKVENAELHTSDQVVFYSVLEHFYSFVENQIQVEKQHKEKFVSEFIEHGNPYSKFNVWRNKMLNIEPDVLELQIKNYCIENQRRYPANASKREKLNFLDSHIGLRNAIFDFLSIKGVVNAVKIADLVKRMADAKNLQIYAKNETNLFQTKEQLNRKELGM